MKASLGCILFIIAIAIVDAYAHAEESKVEGDQEQDYSCEMSDEEARKSPWLGWLRISDSFKSKPQDAYWPVVVIGPRTLLTGARAFRSPYSVQRLHIEPNHDLDSDSESDGKRRYFIHLKDNDTRLVSFVHINPNVSVCAEHWMQLDNEFVLVHVNEPIPFSEKVRPLCLPSWEPDWWAEQIQDEVSFIEEDEEVIVSGWICSYQSAYRQKDAFFHVRVKNYSDCESVWRNQADYSLSEDPSMSTEYVNRACGIPNITEQDQAALKDGEGLCVDKFYFTIMKEEAEAEEGTQNNQTVYAHILAGMFNGVAQEVYAGPTAYALLLNPAILSWINASLECGPDNFTCDNLECAGSTSMVVCDGTLDCEDESDENPLFCTARGQGLDLSLDCGEEKATNPETRPQGPSPWLYVGGGAAFLTVTVLLYFRLNQKRKRQNFYLTDDEIREFRQGKGLDPMITAAPGPGFWADDNSVGSSTSSSSHSGDFDVQDGQSNSMHMHMPFIYDLQRQQIKIGEEIGAGCFGIVHKGVVAGKTVAIKVLKRELVNKEMFKTFLVELKIMAFVNFVKGGHDNVVRLIGADTEQIRNFELFIVVEYCQYGSISDFMQKNRKRFQATVTRNLPGNPPPPVSYIEASSLERPFGIQQLHDWTLQIVDGMQFLASHKIIHGDLAARNVLLDGNLSAKISDFGLSRQVYYCSIAERAEFAKIRKCARLPWKWMAPEVLATNKMSSKSDVWSFGVTLWELYTLGSEPYGGLCWAPSFVEQLRAGLRLAKTIPWFANEPLYAVMQACWTYDLEARPDFDYLKNVLWSLSWTDLDLELFAYDEE